MIADNSKVKKENLENVDGVKGVFEASGQLQIIIGTGTVNKVYEEFIALAEINAATKDEVKKAAAAKSPWYKRAMKTLGDIFVPIIPAIVASGLLMGLLEGFSNLFPELVQSDAYVIFHLFSNAAFVFLPILIAVSAAKVFGGNTYLGAVIGMIMIHPDLMNAWSVASAENIPTADVWFGLYDINLTGYQGHVIPVVIAIYFMSLLEKKLHKIVPEMIDLFVTPLVTVLATGYFTLTVFGPVFGWLENGILSAVQNLIELPFGIRAALCGGIIGGFVAGILNVGASAYGITGVFGLLITTQNIVQYCIVMGISFVVSFLLTMIIYREKEEEKMDAEVESENAVVNGDYVIASPLAGNVIELACVPDQTFAEGILGPGVAIEPEEGKVYAPADGKVSTIFDTNHAIGLALDNGVELLIHVGINTVELNGEGFTAFVNENDTVKKGQLLIAFDKKLIEEKGYNTVTPVIVTNADDYAEVKQITQGKMEQLNNLLMITRENG